MNLSPTVRWLLGGLAAVVAFLAGFDPFGLSDTAQGVVACLSVLLAALGIVPPQVGGTQQGVVNPSVTEPPAAKIDEAGYAEGGLIVFIAILVIVVLLLKAVTGSWLVFLLLLLILLAFLF